jgi:hypothetical protein
MVAYFETFHIFLSLQQPRVSPQQPSMSPQQRQQQYHPQQQTMLQQQFSQQKKSSGFDISDLMNPQVNEHFILYIYSIKCKTCRVKA